MATTRTSTSATSGTANVALTPPVGSASGDTLFAILVSDGNNTTYTAPDGTWTKLFDYVALAGSQVMGATVFYKVLTGAPAASYTFTASAGPVSGIMSCVDAEGETFDGVTYSGDPTTVTVASYTTNTLANSALSRVLFAIFWNDTDYTVSSAPAGMTLHVRVTEGTSCVVVYSEDDPSGTPISGRSITWSGADDNIGILVLVTYTSGGGGGSAVPAALHHLRQQGIAA